jgi:hypothetical protein
LRTGEDLGAVPVDKAIELMLGLVENRSLELSPSAEA